MRKVIFLQAALVLAATALAAMSFGTRVAVSLLIGGMAYLLPNLWFVARLSAATLSGQARAGSFFAGEFAKIAGTLAILVGAQLIIADLHWLALLVGLFLALKANLLAFLLKT
jgi:ATP synthase protein I